MKVERPSVIIVVPAICTTEAVQEGRSDEGGMKRKVYTIICSLCVTQNWPVCWTGLSGEAGS